MTEAYATIDPKILSGDGLAWGGLRARAEAARIKMDQARATEDELSLMWIAGRCSLETYREARLSLEMAKSNFLVACMEEARSFRHLVGPDVKALADGDNYDEDDARDWPSR